MKHLLDNDKEKLLSQMEKVDYVTSYEFMQRTRSMHQVKNRQPRKMLKIRNCYCEKNFRDRFCELVFGYISYKCFGNMNVPQCAVQRCCKIENFFARKQSEICREIDKNVLKYKFINNSQELMNDEFINKIYSRLSDEWKKLCVRCNVECKLVMIATSGINNIVNLFEDNFVVYNNNSNSYIASDSRRLRYIFNHYLNYMRLNLRDDIDESDVISDILKSLEGTRNYFFNKLIDSNYGDVIAFAKNHIIKRLEQFYLEKYTAENLPIVDNEVFINENRKMRGMALNFF